MSRDEKQSAQQPRRKRASLVAPQRSNAATTPIQTDKSVMKSARVARGPRPVAPEVRHQLVFDAAQRRYVPTAPLTEETTVSLSTHLYRADRQIHPIQLDVSSELLQSVWLRQPHRKDLRLLGGTLTTGETRLATVYADTVNNAGQHQLPRHETLFLANELRLIDAIVMATPPLVEEPEPEVAKVTGTVFDKAKGALTRTVARGDRLLAALARSPLPPVELVAAANLKEDRDLGRFCRLWALQVAATFHVQTPTEEYFQRAGNEEASRYVPHIDLWFDSRSPKGGATRLTQMGFNPIMYGSAAKKSGPINPAVHLLTNDGLRGNGYRFVATGEEVMAYFRSEAELLENDALREFFRRVVEDVVSATEATARRERPSHFRDMVRVTYGFNRGKSNGDFDGGVPQEAGYVSISFGRERRQEVLAALFGKDIPEEPMVSLLMDDKNNLVLRPHPHGWKLTASGNIQCSTLSTARIPAPPAGIDDQLNLNTTLFRVEGGLAIKIPEVMFRRTKAGGTGLKTRQSSGSAAGRARTKEDRGRISKHVIEKSDA